VVSSVGGQSAANVASAAIAANNATDADTASTIVKRDASGNFSAATPTASTHVANKAYVDALQPEMWVLVNSDYSWTDLGASTANSGTFHVVDVSNFTQVKVVCYVSTAGSAGSTMTVAFQTSGGGFAALSPSTDISTTGTQETSYANIPGAAISLGPIRIVARASGGDGAADPHLQGIAIMLR
jgi:hypothetical protein